MTGVLVDMASVIVAYFAWLKEWQTLAGAIFGFSGIILTLWYNSGQERRRYRTERQSYLSAIRAELENYQDELASMVRLFGQPGERRLYVPPRLSEPNVFKANLDKVGLLGKDAAHAVLKAYEMIERYEDLILPHLDGLRRHMTLERIGRRNYVLPSVIQPQIQQVAEGVGITIRLATQRIDDQLLRLRRFGWARARWRRRRTGLQGASAEAR